MPTTDWRAVALAAAERALARADAGRAVACGFTGDVDRVAHLDQAALARLLDGAPDLGHCLAGPRVAVAATVDDLRCGILQCVAAGDGTDLPVPDPAVQAWLLAHAPGRRQIGGTGAQAAVTLDRLGIATLLHLTGRSPEQIAALGPTGHLRVSTPDGPRRPAEAADPADRTMWHPILEFAAGLTFEAGGRAHAAPAPNRVIVSHDPVNADFAIAPGFADAVADPANPLALGAVLLSGYSQIVDPDRLAIRLAETVAVLRRWRAARPGLLLHLELGATPDPGLLRRTVEALGPHVDSVGLNIDELAQVAGALPPPEPEARRDLLAAFWNKHPVPRLGLHTRDGCLTLTRRDPEAERDALAFACLVAATRARTGAFPARADLAATLDPGFSPVGLAAAERLAGPNGIAPAAGGWLVAVPAPRVPAPQASVGLGDSFTGALLAAL